MPAFLPYLAAGAGAAGLNFLGGASRAAQMDKLRKELMALFSSGNLLGEANNIFRGIQGSPMYGGARRGAMLAANNAGNQISGNFARAGLGRSGLAATAVPIARSSFQNNFANIDADFFQRALSEAGGLLQGRAGVLAKTSTPGAFALGAGGTLESIMPLLLAYFGGK